MNYNIEKFSNQTFAYMRRTGAYGTENYELMNNLKNWLIIKKLFHDNLIIYGIARDDPQFVLPEKCRYDVGIVVDNSFSSSDLTIDTILHGKYLVFKIKHTIEAIQNFWNLLFEIIKKENYQLDNDRFILERYVMKDLKQGLCEFCIPIK